MKKILLLTAAALMIASAEATTPQQRSDVKPVVASQLQRKAQPRIQYLENKMYTPGSGVLKAPKKADYIVNWYNRPAGAFFVDNISVDGAYGYAYETPFLFLKPFKEYTWCTHADGADENTHYAWDIFIYNRNNPDSNYVSIEGDPCVTVSYDIEISDVPKSYAVDGPLDDPASEWYCYQMKQHSMAGSVTNPIIVSETPLEVFSLPSEKAINSNGSEVDYWGSSKTMVDGGRWGDKYVTMTAYSGAEPYPGNDRGWWFGKNGSHIDGMAQAFEKPTSPYMLKKIGFYMSTAHTKINNPVKLTCKVYRLDGIPAYNDTASVRLPEIPGELIVTGEGMLTQSVLDSNYGFMEFTLYGHNEEDPELTYEYSPTIDCPILVTIEGYNEAEDLVDFTSYISADEDVDEGFGELAYLKYPIYVPRIDENGDTVRNEAGEIIADFTGEYTWRGLNNFFASGQMMTGFAIYVCTENPFITFKYSSEDGEHTFPTEGGTIVKDVEVNGETCQVEGIDFFSWVPSVDGDWELTCNGGDELPDWLDIQLEDVDGNETSGWDVHADVTAQPLPEGVAYREAIVRFGIPGDCIEYKFMQGLSGPIPPRPIVRGDADGNGEVNIADVNFVVNLILSGGSSQWNEGVDVDGDYEITIADINYIVQIILGE